MVRMSLVSCLQVSGDNGEVWGGYGRRHGGRTPPRWSTADIHHESGNKHNTANAVHFGLRAGWKGENALFEL